MHASILAKTSLLHARLRVGEAMAPMLVIPLIEEMVFAEEIN
jgi:hypothetical protein